MINYGDFEMPKLKIPKFKHKENSQRRSEIAKVPFKYRITNYWGEDQAYFKFKRKTLLEKEDYPEKFDKFPEINQAVLETITNDLNLG